MTFPGRWIEQWIPHSGWFLVAASAMAQAPVAQAPQAVIRDTDVTGVHKPFDQQVGGVFASIPGI
jgi:hypothetical protein